MAQFWQGLLYQPDCHVCPLVHDTKVLPCGPIPAKLCFVGEGPGRTEVIEGRGFVGAAGDLLWKLAAAYGVTREEVWISNAALCVWGMTGVFLPDWTTRRIAQLVSTRYDGEVLTLDEDGSFSTARVVGWHRNKIAGRDLIKVSYKSAKGNSKGTTGTILTGDHPVLTERGYIEAEQLLSSDKVATPNRQATDTAESIVYGTLLGDGTISRSRFSQLACERHQDYLVAKTRALSNLGAAIGVDGRMNLPANRWFNSLAAAFHLSKRSGPCWWKNADVLLPHMTAEALAIAYLDDGNLSRRSDATRRPRAELGVCDFSRQEAEKVSKAINELGFSTRVGGSTQQRIYFSVKDTPKLSRLVRCWALPSMQHKLLKEDAGYYQPGLYNPKPTVPFFDTVQVEPYTPDLRGRKDRTVYCLDVERTHNFVTVGGVVHNCYPRDVRLQSGTMIKKAQVKKLSIKACRKRLLWELMYVTGNDPTAVIVPIGGMALGALSPRKNPGIFQYRGSLQQVSLQQLWDEAVKERPGW